MTKKLNFDGHLSILCKKFGAKVTALARMVKIIPFEKNKLLRVLLCLIVDVLLQKDK